MEKHLHEHTQFGIIGAKLPKLPVSFPWSANAPTSGNPSIIARIIYVARNRSYRLSVSLISVWKTLTWSGKEFFSHHMIFQRSGLRFLVIQLVEIVFSAWGFLHTHCTSCVLIWVDSEGEITQGLEYRIHVLIPGFLRFIAVVVQLVSQVSSHKKNYCTFCGWVRHQGLDF